MKVGTAEENFVKWNSIEGRWSCFSPSFSFRASSVPLWFKTARTNITLPRANKRTSKRANERANKPSTVRTPRFFAEPPCVPSSLYPPFSIHSLLFMFIHVSEKIVILLFFTRLTRAWMTRNRIFFLLLLCGKSKKINF